MKRTQFVALAGAMLAGIAILVPNVGASAATACNGTITGTVAGNLTVSGTDACLLSGAVVTGNVVQTGGTLDVRNSTINGSLTVTGAAPGSQNDICGAKIGGTVSITGLTPSVDWYVFDSDNRYGNTPPCDPSSASKIGGAVTIANNFGVPIRLRGATVGGNVAVTNNTSPALFPDIATNTIAGNLNCTGNAPAPVATEGPNTVKGKKLNQCTGL